MLNCCSAGGVDADCCKRMPSVASGKSDAVSAVCLPLDASAPMPPYSREGVQGDGWAFGGSDRRQCAPRGQLRQRARQAGWVSSGGWHERMASPTTFWFLRPSLCMHFTAFDKHSKLFGIEWAQQDMGPRRSLSRHSQRTLPRLSQRR